MVDPRTLSFGLVLNEYECNVDRCISGESGAPVLARYIESQFFVLRSDGMFPPYGTESIGVVWEDQLSVTILGRTAAF
jgi:hypothetical protein